ncbi:MAG: TatD family hydrolase [Deltaproteobacteria bacterium]|nr:TatD family hydrolase [Deltaproteobacteria bacterium]
MLIDAHSHIDKYVEELDLALEEIRSNKIFTLAVSMDVASYERTKVIAQESEFVVPTFGIHPWEAPNFSDELGFLDSQIDETPIIGEIGLDFHFIKDSTLYPKQRSVFQYFLEAAAKQGKIVNLHTKGAEKEVVEKLEEFRIPRSIVHWYSGPITLIERYLAAGTYFTVGVELLFSDNIRSILEAIPNDRLLTETDNPGGYRWLTQKVGMPSVMHNIIGEIARCRGMTESDVKSLVAKNSETLMSTSKPIMKKWASISKGDKTVT